MQAEKMAASMMYRRCGSQFYNYFRMLSKDKSWMLQNQTRSLAWWNQKATPEEPPSDDSFQENKNLPIKDQLQSLKKRTSIQTVKGYKPPPDVEEQVHRAVRLLYSTTPDIGSIKLTDRRVKFKLLTRLMKELDHDIPNMELSNMRTVDDVVTFFSDEVRDTSALEDLSRLDLPENLHMNLEYIRFDPDDKNDITRGVSAFPKPKTGFDRMQGVRSVKYKRKYQ